MQFPPIVLNWIYDKARLYLGRALALKPDDPDALTGMAHTLYDTGDFVAAAGYYEKVLAQKPDDADLRADLGSTYAQRNPPDLDRALAEYRKALSLDPSTSGAGATRGRLHSKGYKATARDANKLAASPANPRSRNYAPCSIARPKFMPSLRGAITVASAALG